MRMQCGQIIMDTTCLVLTWVGSRVPIETIEEDGVFDWEASVKEIDMACLKTTNAHPPITANLTKPPAKRQSTLVNSSVEPNINQKIIKLFPSGVTITIIVL
ncbi:hypothetical protein AtNW77_Chr2g0231231 [Arabidopsis thaliana]